MPVKRKAAVAPFRIFSGFDKRQAEAAEVFAFSVREHASIPVEIAAIAADPGPDRFTGGNLPMPVKEADGHVSVNGFRRAGVTQFSYVRFLVPWMCDFQGRALFADGVDMLRLGDVAELADWDMAGHAVRVVKHEFHGQARPRSWTSLMLLDNAKLTAWTPEFVESAPDEALMRFGGFPDALIGGLPVEWNMMMQPDAVWDGQGAKMLHWSYLSQPEGGDWIDRSGSHVWTAARERWRAAR